MNRRSYLRIAIHLAAVAVALGLGFVVRGMLPARDGSAAAAKSTMAKSAKSLESQTQPAAEKPQSISEMSSVDYSALQERIRNITRCANPLREQLQLRAELVAAVNTVEDFQRAMELLESAGTEVSFVHQTVAAMAEHLAERDPAGAAGVASGIQDRMLRGMSISKAMEAWAKRDPDAALAYASSQGIGIKSNALHPIFRELAKRDPAAAMARIGEFKEPGVHGLDRVVLSQWWKNDREGAIEWVNGRAPDERRSMMRTLVDVGGSRDPEGTWKLIQSLPAADKPEGWALFGLINSWARKDPNAALEAALTETNAERRGEMLHQLTRSIRMGEGGEEKATALLEKISDEPTRQRVLAGLIEGTLYSGNKNQDYQRVLDLTMQIADEAQRLDLIKSIGGNWSRADAPTASEWLNTLQPGAERDGAIGEFVRGTFDSDPAAALSWSASIADEGKRSRRFMELYPQWLKTDAPAATAWLAQQTRLSAPDRAALEAIAASP